MARRSGRRTDYSWFQIGDVLDNLDIGADSTAIAGSQILQAQTVTRMRGRIGATLNAGGPNEFGLLMCGITIMGVDAFALGAAMPEIYSEGPDEASWIWQGSIYLSSGTEVAGEEAQLSGSIEVDTKAMRKVKTLEVIAFVVQTPGQLWSDQGGTVDVVGHLHILAGL